MFSFLCRFAPYCLNFSARALTNTANHSRKNDDNFLLLLVCFRQAIWKAQQVISFGLLITDG